MRMLGRLAATLLLSGVAAPVGMTLSAPASARPPIAVSARAHGGGDCPIDRLAGQITDIQGPPDQVELVRAGRRLTTFPSRCILYGDQLKAGPNALVRVYAAQGTREFGGKGEAPVWAPEGRESERSPDIFASVQSAVGTLFGRGGLRRESAIGRQYGVCRDDQYSGRPVAALSRLPTVREAFGADQQTMVVAWTSGSARSRISLVGGDGATVAETEVCNTTIATLALPLGRLRPGEHLTLTIEDNQGGALRYPIDVVSPERLDHPAKPVGGWLLGAWRLTSGSDAQRLDALSRLARGADEAYAARRILDAVVADETF